MIPARAEPLTIAGAAGDIEALIEVPAAPDAAPPSAFAVICHPHPLHGGTMHNKVVSTLARTCNELGVPTIRFNFRGVGKSAGAFDEGSGETDDALAAVAVGRQRWPDAALWLAGFSFGGYVALRAASRGDGARATHLVTVAPAFTRYFDSPAAVPMPACPWLIVQGDADEVIDAQAVIEWAKRLVPPPRLAVLEGVGHFFHGRLNQLRDTVMESLQ
ncbi:MAG: alpha/beta fold hydrolase [Pseudomonadota bacterium]